MNKYLVGFYDSNFELGVNFYWALEKLIYITT